ncbi:MAG: CAP domain-containing protein [Ruminococcus sp.]|nr:CAP domain-containing protein [Ruminococcus sp.]MCM1381924.1 CAP domain-containing protein [Muribaculaceae bacterium]MCM1480077.1 CAP domain-containing protein [Muribaculaceae bacterium]
MKKTMKRVTAIAAAAAIAVSMSIPAAAASCNRTCNTNNNCTSNSNSNSCGIFSINSLCDFLKKIGINIGGCNSNSGNNSSTAQKPDTTCPDGSCGTTQKPDTTCPDGNCGTTQKPDTTCPDGNCGTTQKPSTTVQKPSTGTTTDKTDVSDYEKEVVTLVNGIRKEYGLGELTLNTELSAVARAKSQDMKDNGYFSHTSPTYGSPFDMMKTFGISYGTAGENIAMGYRTPEAVVDAWMNSEGHRANILNSSYKEIGVGYVSSGNYWTQMFIG